MDNFLGLLETGATLGSGALSGLLGMPYGLYKGVTSGAYGTPLANRIAEEEARKFMERNTYVPRTQAGQENLQAIAGLLEKSKLPPVMPEISLLGQIPRQAYAAQAERAGMAAERALEPVVQRTLERGGKGAQLLQDLSQGSISPLDVWHGSPHGPFTSFDRTKIGSGEGAQAYGYGHYTGEARGTGEGYMKNLSDFDIKVDGKPFNTDDVSHFAAMSVWQAGGDKKKAIDSLRESAISLKSRNVKWADDLAKENIQQIEYLESGKPVPKYKEESKGYLYKIDLPDEAVAQMLDWDKLFSEQPKQVQNALKNSNIAEIWKSQYGFDIEKNKPQMDLVYKAVSEQLGSPDAASQYFKDLGIPGIRYLDEGSRNLKKDWTVEIKDFGSYDFPSLDEAKAFMKSNPQYEMNLIEPQKSTSNFVVFPGNEDLLRILEINDKPLGLLE
jgi:hypothetical protein